MPGLGYPLHCFVALYVGEGSESRQCHCLAAGGLLGIHPTSSHFTHFPYAIGALLAVSLVLVPTVGGFVYILGLYGPFKQTLLRDQQVLPEPQTPLVFIARSYETLFYWRWNPGLRSLAWGSDHSLLSCPSQFLSTMHECGTLILPAAAATTSPPAPRHRHTVSFPPSSPAPPHLPIWMKIASLDPWLSDFHTVQFSGSSECFLF